MEKKILEVYRTSEAELRAKWDEFMEEQNAYIKDLQEAYYQAKNAGFTDEARKLGKQLGIEKKKRLLQNSYYRDMVEAVTEQIAHVNEIAVAYINDEVPEFYAINRNGANEYISSVVSDDVKVELGIRYDLMDARTAKLLLTEDNFYKPLFKKVNVPKDKRWNRKLIHSQITQGILQGETVNKIASRIMNVTDANAASAVRNARTMCTAAENRGRMDSYEDMQERGIVLEKIWSAAVGDGRTRDWHLELNGVAKEIDEPFINSAGEIMYPGDPSAAGKNIYNCRCALRTHVIGFRKKDGSISRVSDYM